ncbi:MAG TPA: membrane protein insertase YidC [Burkholderiales bacterium]|nr:membrane protein insertase YidC [Burkholderiales bacterium]
MDTRRTVLLFIFGFSLLMLWEAWQADHRPKPEAQTPSSAAVVPGSAAPSPAAAANPAALPAAAGIVPGAAAPAVKGQTIKVHTDLVDAEIDTLGATLTHLELLRHKEAQDLSKNLTLFGPEHHYEAQSGLVGEGPNHRTLWSAKAGEFTLAPGQDFLEVQLTAQGANGLEVTKTYRFKRDSYLIEVALEMHNKGAAPVAPATYFQFTHDGKPPADANTGAQNIFDSIAHTFGAQSFFGYAVYTEEKKFQKVHLTDIDKNKADYVKQSNDGWLAYVQHYFVAGWIPPENTARSYELLKRDDGNYSGYVRIPVQAIAPGAAATVKVSLYAGPQEQRRLAAVAPGFDRVVDFGLLTVIAEPLFWLLGKYHSLSGNWGVAIILLTMTIKLLFFPLSAASYKSMAKMKLVTPRMQKIREMYEHDRQKMNQAMMELYKTEKINPLGGCFPILIQIPVFISLYWVLLAAIELRHTPFILWIQDLSARDPYFVLPVLMTVTMVVQTRLNPVPPDPVQAKVMQFMPFVFSIFFFFFPAGLVLYWLVNNILSILQQWQIQRMFDRDKPAHAKR